MDMIVKIQVIQLLTWNFTRSVTDLRYFSDQLVDATHFIYSNVLKEQSTNSQQLTNLQGKKTFSLKLDNYRYSIKLEHFFYFPSTFQGVSLYPRKWFGILQFYICLAVMYKIICLQFLICIFLSVLLFYVFVTRESPSVSFLWCFITQYFENACFSNP